MSAYHRARQAAEDVAALLKQAVSEKDESALRRLARVSGIVTDYCIEQIKQWRSNELVSELVEHTEDAPKRDT